MCPNPATLLDSVPVSERRDVVVVGGGLVGVTLAYELASVGAGVTVVDAGTPGRATAAGAGILSPVTSMEDDPELWPFLRGCGAHYPGLLERLAGDGVDVSGAAYGRCGLLSVSLRPHEDEWYGPFTEMVDRRSPGEAVEITAEEASALFPPLAPVHRARHAPSGARVDGQGMESAVRAGAQARGVNFVAGAVTGLEGSDGRVTSVEVDTQGPVSCETLAVAGGAWTSALGEWLACPLPVGPTKGQIVHLGVDDDERRLAHRAAPPYALPGPVARWAGRLRRHLRVRRRLLDDGHRGRVARAPARVPGRGAGTLGRRGTSKPGSACGPPRPTTTPSSGSSPAGPMRSW